MMILCLTNRANLAARHWGRLRLHSESALPGCGCDHISHKQSVHCDGPTAQPPSHCITTSGLILYKQRLHTLLSSKRKFAFVLNNKCNPSPRKGRADTVGATAPQWQTQPGDRSNVHATNSVFDNININLSVTQGVSRLSR